MEDDMKKMHERHVKLMKDVDENYKLIEEETQEHFSEFLEKWKLLAKSKIDQYKSAFSAIKSEKEDIQNRLQAIVTDLQEKNKKLVEDYEKLLEKYHKDIDSEKKQHKGKVELMESTYEEELSKLRQEKIELEGLLEAMKSQKESYEQKTQELRQKLKEKEVVKRDQYHTLVERFAQDSAILVMQHVVDEVELRDGQTLADHVSRSQKKEIESLRQNVIRLEREKEVLREQVKRVSNVGGMDTSKAMSKKSTVKQVGALPGDESSVFAAATVGAALALGDHKKYEELVIEKHRLIKRIQAWKAEFEKKEGRKCEKADCEPIRNLYRDLKRLNEQLMELRGQKPEEASGINDSIVSLGSEGGRSKSLSPRSKGRQTPNDRSFTAAAGSMAEAEELRQENRNLKDELQKLRLLMAEERQKITESDTVKQLTKEVESLNKDKEQWRIKFQELASRTGKDAKQNKDLSEDMEQLKKENTKLQEKLLYMKARSQTMVSAIAGDPNADSAYKQAYDRIIQENQELQKQTQELDGLKLRSVDAETKLQTRDKEYAELREKYERVGLERLALGKQVLKFKEMEAERAKARSEVMSDPSKPEQAKVLKEITKEQEILKAQIVSQEEELKTAHESVNKLTKEKEDILEKLATLRRFETDAKQLEEAQQRLADAERDANDLRVQMAMGLPEDAKDRNTLIKTDYEKVIADSKALRDKLDRTLKRLAALKEVKKSYDDKVAEVFQLRQELKQLQVDFEETTRKADLVDDYKAKVTDLRMQLADKLPRESSNMRQEMRKVVEENKNLQVKSDTTEAIQKQYMEYKAMAENAQIELAKIRQDLKKTELERDGLRAKSDHATSYMMERNALRVQLAKMSKMEDIPHVPGESGAMNAEMSRLLGENEKLLKNVAVTEKVKKENTSKDERIKDLEGKLKASRDRIKELEQLLSKNVESKTREAMDKLRADNKELEKLLEKERQSAKGLKQQVEGVTNKYDQLREKEVTELEEKIKKLEAQHRQDITLFEKLSSEELEKKIKEVEEARSDVAKLTEANAALVTANSELENKGQILSQNVQRLEADLAKVGAEASRVMGLQEKLESTEKELENEKADYVVMEKKYKDEMLQRKRLHNIIEDMKGKIRVYCRVRPLSSKEKDMNCLSIVNIMDEFTVKVDTKYGPKAFAFDAAFGPEQSQEKVFEDTKRLVQSAVDGYNVCIFAYGQTGAGKSFTIQGSDENPGIAPRSFIELEKIIGAMSNYTCTLECYMVELYLDTLSDLLLTKEQRKSPPHLDIKEDMKGMMFVQGSTKHTIRDSSDAKRIFDMGLNNRKTSATQMNDTSSRSHLVFSILIETINKQTGQRAVGKLSYVDLAGSERANKAGTSAAQLKEGRAINKSLSALGDVIAILSTGGKSFVPYRNNKLTMLMKDSIGGNVVLRMFTPYRQKHSCSSTSVLQTTTWRRP